MQARQATAQGSADPFQLFEAWYREARSHPDIADPSATNLATVSPEGAPSSRMVLVKDRGPNGFVFFTNLGSRKAHELDMNPRAALCFHWAPLGKQIRIEGVAGKVSDAEADRYFTSRPLKSRIAAYASKQSARLPSRGELTARVARAAARFSLGNVPRPAFWSGFRIDPHRMEFWTAVPYRLHDRLAFDRDAAGVWRARLLYP